MSHQGSAGATNFPLGENPPNIINPGDAVTVSAGGFINILPFPFYEYYGPSGKAENSSHSYPVPGARKYASLWRFNNNPGGWVDGDWRHTVEFGHCRPAPSLPVRLAFLINDDLLWDNSGEFLYVIQIWRSR